MIQIHSVKMIQIQKPWGIYQTFKFMVMVNCKSLRRWCTVGHGVEDAAVRGEAREQDSVMYAGVGLMPKLSYRRGIYANRFNQR